MYRPRQPERTEPSGTAPAGRENAPSPGSLLNARRLQPDAREANLPEARPQATPGSLLAAGPAAQARTPGSTPPAPPAPVQQASASSFLPGLPAIGTLGIDDFVAWLRDGWKWIALSIVLCMAAAFAYSLVVTSRYSVYTDIVIDPANLNVVTDDVFTTSPQRDAQLMEVESRLRVLTSRTREGAMAGSHWLPSAVARRPRCDTWHITAAPWAWTRPASEARCGITASSARLIWPPPQLESTEVMAEPPIIVMARPPRAFSS